MTLKGIAWTLRHDWHYLRPRIVLFLFNLIPDFLALARFRNAILRLGGAKIGGAYIRSPLYASDLRGLEIGQGVFLNMGCRIQGTTKIRIGDGCQIGPFVCLETMDHIDGDRDRPITIGSGVCLGARVIVVGGVSIGDGATIGTGAVVTKDVPAGARWGGVPARALSYPVRGKVRRVR